MIITSPIPKQCLGRTGGPRAWWLGAAPLPAAHSRCCRTADSRLGGQRGGRWGSSFKAAVSHGPSIWREKRREKGSQGKGWRLARTVGRRCIWDSLPLQPPPLCSWLVRQLSKRGVPFLPVHHILIGLLSINIVLFPNNAHALINDPPPFYGKKSDGKMNKSKIFQQHFETSHFSVRFEQKILANSSQFEHFSPFKLIFEALFSSPKFSPLQI